ncbi:sugar ABC transporter permease [Sinanaerobacter chloroacetimidivorans]|uniref:Xylose transport system permease protein XylH n=1 Tax=Sinanaerobacter chloroacetimidivorans TaxID=2818044 RepID=A0A8J8B2C0_9FIRM|nr:sugar ABC transporter permease [Sinanaerobacter chloroacetimidivorans]MBR0597100.1 sugar ABC transporter permease [Sinanaerobacter chloroacetimidivorans]
MIQKEETLQRYTVVKKIDIRTFTMFAVLVVLWLFFTYFTSDGFSNLSTSFLSTRNLSNLMRQMTTVGIMGISMVLVIVSGGIDLSAGAVVGFIGCVAAALQVFWGMGTAETILICLIVSVAVYVVQGSLIAYLDLAPFIVTLGGMLVFKGLILVVTEGATIAPLQESLLYFGQAYISKPMSLFIGILLSILLLLNGLQRRASKRRNGTLTESPRDMLIHWALTTAAILIAVLIMNSYRGMPVPVLIMFILVILLTLVAERTTFGRSIYAIGGNLDAARYSGINVKKNLVLVYSIHGLMIGVAGLVLAARLNASTTTVANMSLELDAIAAAVIGGTSMTGGIGKVAGAILGALIMATIDNGMSMMNLDAFWQYIVKGIILVAAVWFDIRTNKKRKS